MTAALWWLQAAYAAGFLGLLLAGSRRRRIEMVGWLLGVASEIGFAVGATIGHIPSAYPWIVAWGTVYIYNWRKWTRETHAVHLRSASAGSTGLR